MLGQFCPRDTCQVVLKDFDKIQHGQFLPSPIVPALKNFDNFQNVVLMTTANRDLCTSERLNHTSMRVEGAGSSSIGGSEGGGKGGGETYIYKYINRDLALWWW